MNTLIRLFALALLALAVGVQPSHAQDQLFLWKVTSDAGTAYLYGSIHLATPEMYPLDDNGTRQVIYCIAVPERFQDSSAAFEAFHARFTPPGSSE